MIQRKNLLERKMKNGFGKSVSTYPIELKSTIENPVRDLKVYGNSEQEVSTEGRNMCPTDFSEWELGHYNNTTGEKHSHNNRVRLNRLLKIQPETDYYYDLFWNRPEDETTDVVLLIRTYDVNKKFLRAVGTYLQKAVYTTASDEYYVSLTIAQGGQNFTWTYETYKTFFENGIVKPLWCLNSETDKTFVEYVPNSPSPEYPSEIESCGDEGYVEVSAREENFIDTSIFEDRTINGMELTRNKDGSILINGTTTALLSFQVATDFIIPAGDYTVYIPYCPTSGLTVSLGYNTTIKGTDIQPHQTTGLNAHCKNITFEKDTPVNQLRFYIANGKTYDNYLLKWMLIKGTYTADTIPEYKQYRGTTINFPLTEPLRKVGDVADYIDWKNRQVVRNVYSIILDGTENWKTSDAYTGYYRYNFAPSLIALKGNVNGTKGTNTHFFQRTGQNHGGYEYLYVQKNSGGGNIYIQSDKYATVEELSNYLTEQYNAGTPVKTIFVGESATYEPFTEEQNAIADLILTPNYCNITSSNKIKPSKIEFSYKSKVR